MPRPTPHDAACAAIDALRIIVLLDRTIEQGGFRPEYRKQITENFEAFYGAIDRLAASLCDDEENPDLNDAEICLLARLRQNQAAEEAPEQPDALARAIMQRAGCLI